MNGIRRVRRARGQIVPLFALGLIGFTALIGVLLDGGTLYVQRRTAQNAADAAALAGARGLQQATSSPTSGVPFQICKYVLANNFGVTPSATAYFVDVNGAKVAGGDIALPTNCSGSVSGAAILNGTAGVHVDVSFGPYNTYLAGIVGIRTLSASASATAQVWNFAVDASTLAPWAICGPTAPTSTSGVLADILDTTTNTILPSAIAAHISVILEGSKMNAGASGWLPATPACPDSTGSSWKGQVSESGLIVPPVNLATISGNGSITTQCQATGQNGNPTGPGQCYLFVPVTDAHNQTGQAHVVTFACMDIYPGGSGNDKWWGALEPVTRCPYYPYKPLWQFGTSTGNTVVALTL
ncbi:MAG TPA: pilus assembly protein TadG-related protein [Chloroflexota bacterium]|jgi:Flp pilus assembly protein TadG|nr:pilus assembly protein TadG-related protein [Chloroflexota bacterium]